ncbi:MAG: capsule biosynthesis protein CapK [Anaerolineae bacterium]
MREPSDEERFPLLTGQGRKMLEFLREHPSAPRYTARSGNRLTAEGLARVRAFDAELRATPVEWTPGAPPAWVNEFVERCYREVPFYRRYGAPPDAFALIPTTDREALARESWSFVPDPLPLDDLIIYSTSGTTGHRIIVPWDPVAAGCYLPLLNKALSFFGLALTSGGGEVACFQIGWQKECFTYVSVTPYLDEAGFAKINLHPSAWREPDDRVRYLDACHPEIFSGDPISFMELARLPLQTRPKALFSTSMALLPGLRARLETRFDCPVLDLYSSNETGLVAVAFQGAQVILPHRLYVEILDESGAALPPGVRGEITLTGGINPYFPMLRYRTGDYASLAFRGRQPALAGLEGRPPTVFYRTDGQAINNIDVTHALAPFPLAQYTLHQAADGALTLRLCGVAVDEAPLRAALLKLFGPDQRLDIERVEAFERKVVQYTTANSIC